MKYDYTMSHLITIAWAAEAAGAAWVRVLVAAAACGVRVAWAAGEMLAAVKGVIIFYKEGRPSICDELSPIFSGPPPL